MESLFAKSEKVQFNACVGDNGGPYHFLQYSIGYYEAANKIVESLFLQNHHIDLQIYPILYLYRQYLELMLKHLAITSSVIFKKGGRIKLDHDLNKIWTILKGNICGHDLKICEDDISIVHGVVTDISIIDPKGEVFRYPFNKELKANNIKIGIINIEIIHKLFQKVNSILSEIDTRLDAIKEVEYDIKEY